MKYKRHHFLFMERYQQENPKFLIIFNFDVSESMAKPFDDTVNSTTSAETIFSALDKLVQNTNKYKIIKVGGALFGCKPKQECDFMKMISSIEINENLNQIAVSQEIIEYCNLNSTSYRERLGKLGEKFGAKYLIKYLQKTSEKQCEEIYKIAIGDSNLCTLLVDNLPPKVKNGAETALIHGGKGFAKASPFLCILAGAACVVTAPLGGAGLVAAPILFSLGLPSYFGSKAIDEKYDSSVQEEVDRALQICTDNISNRISCDKYDWDESFRLTLLSGENLKKELEEFKNKVKIIGFYPLMNYFKKFVYGRTATSVALTNSFATFLDNQKTRYRILFLITDGEHNEGLDPYEYLVENFENDDLKDIIFVSCYIYIQIFEKKIAKKGQNH